jgi:hypothetical protein
MLADRIETTGEEIAEGREAYEPPAILAIGSLADLTSSPVEGSIGDFSDRILKQRIEPLEDPVGRLRAVRTR